MRLFGLTLGKGEDAGLPPETAAQMAPGTEIRYAPGLIAHFQDTHKELAALIAQLHDTASAGRYGEAEKALHELKSVLYAHLLEENVRLYTYLSYCVKDDADGAELMSDMRLEMGRIGRDVTRFIRAYAETGIGAGNVASFLQQLGGITAKLHDRLQREESSLYTLYQPPAHFARQDA
ncbi:MAG TPA: hemerythrin domain-containing protein [Rhodanobacteraceae bacterium]|nr:hemerythrin domain-containing protein [Rhodanobacteraceae bacterium]